jgi:hypothetical protein
MLLLLAGGCADPEPTPLDPADCVVATPDDVQERRGDWYRCLDTTLRGGRGCGPDGYPLGFGAKYADRSFDEAFDDLGPEGRDFFLAVAPCLQERLAERVTADATCDEVWDAGFSTHAGCYLDSGFCALPPADLLVLAGMFDPDVGELPEFQQQMTEVAELCAAAE